jgi:hypothetical protein
MPEPKVELAEITPTKAHELLGMNTHNRDVRPNRVEELAGAITRGEWKVNGDAIRISATGVILDGQHRLLAVIKADKPIESFVITGLADDTQSTMDQARRRTFADSLKLDGETDYNGLASVTRVVWNWNKFKVPSGQNIQITPTIAQLYDTLAAHPGIRDATIKAHRLSYKPPGLTRAQVGGLAYVFSLHTSVENVDAFFESITSGAGLEEGDPRLLLRRRLERDLAAGSGTAKLHSLAKAALTVKAFNAWMSGKKIHQLKWSIGGADPERFPLIEVPAE